MLIPEPLFFVVRRRDWVVERLRDEDLVLLLFFRVIAQMFLVVAIIAWILLWFSVTMVMGCSVFGNYKACYALEYTKKPCFFKKPGFLW